MSIPGTATPVPKAALQRMFTQVGEVVYFSPSPSRSSLDNEGPNFSLGFSGTSSLASSGVLVSRESSESEMVKKESVDVNGLGREEPE